MCQGGDSDLNDCSEYSCKHDADLKSVGPNYRFHSSLKKFKKQQKG